MVDTTKIADAIKGAPEQAAQALLAVQAGLAKPMTMPAFEALANPPIRAAEDMAADEIEKRGLMDAFVQAMKARGVVIETDDAVLADANFPMEPLGKFVPRGGAFRCRVFVNRNFSGSGCLVSPSLVLTAWHVISNSQPGVPDPKYQPIEVLLSDGTRRRALPEPVYVSPCTALELAGKFPSDDAMFSGFNDVALIRLERPDGIRLGFTEIPAETAPPLSRSAILLLHFPNGNDPGFGFGKIGKLRGITARWKHDVSADAGSSGGPCFNTAFTLAGLHQGKWPPERRMVPSIRFIDDIRPWIEEDIAPPTPWSLDGTTSGPLVIGRDLFFEATAAAARPESRVRGIRVKRRDAAQGTTGLAYSLEMLTLVLTRSPGSHRTVRISLENQSGDLLEEVRRRAAIAEVNIPPAVAGAGARLGETTLEATLNDRARNLTADINAVAERNSKLVWFLFDNPPAGLADEQRFAFEAFIGAAMRQPRLRLVLTGLETITTPGDEFATPGVTNVDGAPGLVVEYFGLFNRGDVEQLLIRACRDFGVSVAPPVIADRANQILLGLTAITGQYSVADLQSVSQRAVDHLDYLKSLAGAQP